MDAVAIEPADGSQTPAMYIDKTNTATAVTENPSTSRDKKKFIIVYKTPYGGQMLEDMDPETNTLRDLKRRVLYKTGIAIEKQKCTSYYFVARRKLFQSGEQQQSWLDLHLRKCL